MPGIGLTLLAGCLTLFASAAPALSRLGVGGLTLAILLGIAAGNTFYFVIEKNCQPGVGWIKHHALRWGIMLYGFRISLQQIADVGPSALLIDLLTLGTTFLLACWLGIRKLGMSRDSVWLIGAGSSICGAAAVIATSSTLGRQDNRHAAVAIATVVTFGTLAMFLYPWLYHWLPASWGINPAHFGIYIGSTIHEIAQVVAAGEAISPQAGEAAVVTKMVRVMLLAPFLLLLVCWIRRGMDNGQQGANSLPIPWFAMIFLLVALLNSLDLLPAALLHALIAIDQFLLILAMAALGLETRWQAVYSAGGRPLLLAGALMLWLVFGGAAINYSFILLH